MEPPGALEEPAVDRPVDVVRRESGGGRLGTVVQDLGRTKGTPLADDHAGPRIGIDGQIGDVDAFAAQSPDDGRPESVGTHATDERDRVAESGKADRDVRLGAGDVALEGGRLRQRTWGHRHECREAFAERHDLEPCGRFHDEP